MPATDGGSDGGVGALVQIGVLAEQVGLSLRTVRYYEEVGLVTPIARSKGGFRMYGPDQKERLLVLKTMKPLGFTLEEMREIVGTLDEAAHVRGGSRRAVSLLARVDALRGEIARRRDTLTQQLAATQQLTIALDKAARQARKLVNEGSPS